MDGGCVVEGKLQLLVETKRRDELRRGCAAREVWQMERDSGEWGVFKVEARKRAGGCSSVQAVGGEVPGKTSEELRTTGCDELLEQELGGKEMRVRSLRRLCKKVGREGGGGAVWGCVGGVGWAPVGAGCVCNWQSCARQPGEKYRTGDVEDMWTCGHEDGCPERVSISLRHQPLKLTENTWTIYIKTRVLYFAFLGPGTAVHMIPVIPGILQIAPHTED